MSINVLDIISNLGRKEQQITNLEFISPIFYNNSVVTTIDGLVYTFKVPNVDPGWYKIRPLNSISAKITGDADFTERELYLRRLGRLRVTLTLRRDKEFLAI
jgi:hypothetical protein